MSASLFLCPKALRLVYIFYVMPLHRASQSSFLDVNVEIEELNSRGRETKRRALLSEPHKVRKMR
jgi:hypothetical protein